MGAYADVLLRPADRLVKVPAGIDDQVAAAIMLKGMTAWYLCRRTYAVKKGDTILVHAAAGGVGQLLCQWAKHLGATVIGTVGSDDKVEAARKSGCKHVVVTSKENFVDRVKEITKGAGLPVVYDGVGKVTFLPSLDCLRPLGIDGELRQRVGSRGSAQHRNPVAEGLPVPDAAHALHLHVEAGRPVGGGG
jgi:NADPH2:quinone reductase